MSMMKDIYCDMCDVVTDIKEGNLLPLKDVMKGFYKPVFKEWYRNIFDDTLTNSVWRDYFDNYIFISHYSNGLVWDISVLSCDNKSITYSLVVK